VSTQAGIFGDSKRMRCHPIIRLGIKGKENYVLARDDFSGTDSICIDTAQSFVLTYLQAHMFNHTIGDLKARLIPSVITVLRGMVGSCFGITEPPV